MASPLAGHRQRLARHSLSSTPARSSPLAKSPSTPYDVYRERQQHAGTRFGHASVQSNGSSGAPATPQSSSVFVSPASPNSYASTYRRNAGFGSPGAAAIRASPQMREQGTGTTSIGSQSSASPHGSGSDQQRGMHVGGPRRSSRFVRRKPWKQRLAELPHDLYDRISFSEFLDFGNPALGYPLGAAMHVLSLLVLVMHPDGALHFGKGSRRRTAKASSLFADHDGGGGLASRRRSQQDSAWRWIAGFLAFCLLVAAITNAVHLFTARRRYHLWLKPTDEALQSENASLVDIPSSVDAMREKSVWDHTVDTARSAAHKSWHMIRWLAKRILWRMRNMSYIGIVVRVLFPVFSRINSARHARSASSGPQMHAIDMWQAPEVSLRVFCLYSPLHVLVYLANINAVPLVKLHASGTAGSRISGLIASLAFMTLFSAQTMVLALWYAHLVKDKGIIAGEVLHEYDQKFVMPRAMPLCRDASTMTTEAETIGPEEWNTVFRASQPSDAGARTGLSDGKRRVKSSASSSNAGVRYNSSAGGADEGRSNDTDGHHRLSGVRNAAFGRLSATTPDDSSPSRTKSKKGRSTTGG